MAYSCGRKITINNMDTKTAKPRFMLGIVFLFLFLKTYFSSQGVDIISEGYVLSGDSILLSAGGVFQLGFFKPGRAPNYYVGIWFVEDPSRMAVWVANRVKPVSLSSELKITDGNLVLFDVWSTNSKNNSTTVQEILLDTGNFVFNDIGTNPTTALWQNFDHPTDTWLPGAKIKYNKMTKRSLVFTSWKNSEDPAPGLFSLQLEPSDNSFRLL
ncbi:G-type lectin S-receptor-like serine/threonine-protein kinase [Morus notabilis]|uniref:G-type lectin S-receptor-like serine/threonine-protein kinase n=1 Tax=Morus notabilis TaxID=981085 RepID=W9R8T2_9ROSA|nr:G-type lectin S-receptor-like serine/threonine-protein kinase [Morus notabilis]